MIFIVFGELRFAETNKSVVLLRAISTDKKMQTEYDIVSVAKKKH